MNVKIQIPVKPVTKDNIKKDKYRMMNTKDENMIIGLLLLFGFGLFLWGLCAIKRKLRFGKHQKQLLQRGIEGEQDTICYLEQIRGRKRILSNVYIPKNLEAENSNTTEIDIIVVHEKGIFVVENKNYSGIIIGDDREKNWVQITGKGNSRFFYNPVRQNQNHIKYLQKLLDLEFDITLPYLSLITFNQPARLKQISLEGDTVIVCNSETVRRKLNRFLRFRKKVLNRRQIIEISQYLENWTHVSRKIKKQHVRNLAIYHQRG